MAIFGEQGAVIGQQDHSSFLAQYARHQVLAGRVRQLIDGSEHIRDRLPQYFLFSKPCQRRGRGVHKGDVPTGVSGQHGVADAAECDMEPLPVPGQFFFRLFAFW